MRSSSSERFDIFQLHEGRDSCAPALKLEVQSTGHLAIVSEFRDGPTSSARCIANPELSRARSPDRLSRDGTEYKLDVIFDFTGNGGFRVWVVMNDKTQLHGAYQIPQGRGYQEPTFYRIKHGVYSRNQFPYELVSRDLQLDRVRLAN
jgi:hypothetical protein